MMIMNDLLQKTSAELEKLAGELRAQIRDARFKLSMRQETKVHILRVAKRDLARVLTAKTKTSSTK